VGTTTVRYARRVFFPLDEQLQLKDPHFSEGVLQEIVWVSGRVDSYAAAEEVLQRIGHLCVSDSSVWRRVDTWGAAIQDQEDARREKANTLPKQAHFRRQVQGNTGRVGVSMDGTKVHIRQEGWKELKVGCTFELEVRPTWRQETAEWEDLAHAVHHRYVAHLGGPELLGQQLWAEAQARGWEQADDRQVIGDGAAWIWNLAQEHFYDGQQVVDWYHATEHVSEIAKRLYGEGTRAAQRWYRAAQQTLYQGHAARLAQHLRKQAVAHPPLAADLEREANYLEEHKRRMQYQEFREDGYLIGSGTVESGCKQFKARFCGPGMRWSRSGLVRLIPIRAAVMGHCFDEVWEAVYNSPQI
jgi:hypothetical protein